MSKGERVISDGLPTQIPDTDIEETQEWLDSLDGAIDALGEHRSRYLMLRLIERARERQIGLPSLRSTDYINTIPPEREPDFPGDEDMERRIRRIIRWNTAVMVTRANRPEIGVGGHIATYQSAASLYEVGLNHFFRGKDHPGGGDQVYFQGHASPGMYARAFLEGRLSEQRLDGFRQELSHVDAGGGLPSYPHPRLLSDFWEFPTVSMGIGPMNAVYQARFNRYLHARGIKDTSDQQVWAFLGDGEMDEPESLGTIGIAAREQLDNLTFVINCNLQRLDGPVRGNGKIIQELESYFLGAGWNVIKVVWGSEWDPLLAKDYDGALVHLMNVTCDGDYQTYRAESGAYIRQNFFGRDPRTAKLVTDLSDEQIWGLRRGGHDYRKLYAAYKAASEHTGQPTVILAKTVKGWTLGRSFEGRMASHQMKKLTKDDLALFRDRLQLPISDAELEKGYPAPYYHPGTDSEEVRYLQESRRKLGGYLPERRGNRAKPLPLPPESAYARLRKGSGKQMLATTQATVQLIKDLMRDKEIGQRFVPIIPDEARTFGLDAVFPTAKVYNPQGQTYDSVDRELLLKWRESETGQILHEGINEAGSMASLTAAGTAYATHGEHMIGFYIFYSMFGFQRTGDACWAFSDQLGRGFMLGATAGRTTLNGEGLQHEDGHSLLLAATNPAVVSYDPAFAFEVAHIFRAAMERMYGPNAENVWHYLTIYNEPIHQPIEPEHLDIDGMLNGIYRYAEAPVSQGPRARVVASGIAVTWALAAQRILAEDFGVAAEIYSATSWSEPAREAYRCETWNRQHPASEQQVPFISSVLPAEGGPVIAVSDWMRAVPDQIAPWVKADYSALGTDGFGCSDTRAALRRRFGIDAESIVVQVLRRLAAAGDIGDDVVIEASRRFRIDEPDYFPVGVSAGGES